MSETNQHDFDGYGMCRFCGRGNLEVERGEAPEACTLRPDYHAAILAFERLVDEPVETTARGESGGGSDV